LRVRLEGFNAAARYAMPEIFGFVAEINICLRLEVDDVKLSVNGLKQRFILVGAAVQL